MIERASLECDRQQKSRFARDPLPFLRDLHLGCICGPAEPINQSMISTTIVCTDAEKILDFKHSRKRQNHGKSRKHLGHEANFFHPLGCRDIFWRCFASLFFRCLVFNLPWYSRCQVRSAWVGSMRPLHCPCHILTMSSGYRLGDLRDDWGRLWHWRPKWFNVAQLGSTESLSKFCLNPGYICYMLLLTIPPILMGKKWSIWAAMSCGPAAVSTDRWPLRKIKSTRKAAIISNRRCESWLFQPMLYNYKIQ